MVNETELFYLVMLIILTLIIHLVLVATSQGGMEKRSARHVLERTA